jgi:hypothetical protein
MKNAIFFLTAMFLLLSFTAVAQVSSNGTQTEQETVIPIPDYENCAMYYDRGQNSLVSLEIARAETQNKGSGFSPGLITGIGGSKSNLVIMGGESPVVVPRTAEFVVKLANESADPNSWVMLFKLEQKIKGNPSKSYRYMTMSKTSSFAFTMVGSSKTKSTVGDFQLTPLFKKVKPGVYLLNPGGNLPRGEYIFSIIDPNAEQSTSPMVYAFSVR